MKKIVLLACALLVVLPTIAQRSKRKKKNKEQVVVVQKPFASPKLVVGIIVDQMRYDYITRFWSDYGSDGFKRLVNDGFSCKNNHYNYKPTSTGPGHTSVYTGASPSSHGVIGNNWYDKVSDKMVYCAGDDNYESVGTTSSAGKMSPHRMMTTTITDQLRLATQMRGKTIGIAIKDRGSILPAGHTGTAYWFYGKDEGSWITSTYYMNQLPSWVSDFNTSNIAESYKKSWDLLRPIAEYTESGADANSYEGVFKGEESAIFPHNLPSFWQANGGFDVIKATPYGNSITADFALAALDGEQLGKDNDTDFLAVSFSSTDYVGHKYGVNSVEIQDTYLRLDMDIARLLTGLDEKVGKGNYTVFLTADHAAIHVPSYLKDQKIPAGYLDNKKLRAKLDEFLKFNYGTDQMVKNYSNEQLFLDRKVIGNLGLKLEDVETVIANELMTYDNVYKVYTGHQMWQNEYTEGVADVLQNGYSQKRSGDVLVVADPSFISYSRTGSTHGSSFVYDTHVPLLFYGNGIKKGSTQNLTEIPDIAPTIAALLGIAFPNGVTGKVISEVVE